MSIHGRLFADGAVRVTDIKYYRVSRYYTFNASTKHINGILQAAAERGLEQVVIIGAGLDSRAYRFQQQMPGVRFFEVDLPATVARKKELVLAAVGKLPPTYPMFPLIIATEK